MARTIHSPPALITSRTYNQAMKEGQTSVWRSSLSVPFLVCSNYFTYVKNEIELQYGKTFRRHLTRIYNLRIIHKFKETLLFDDDASGAFRHIKLHPDVVGASAFMIGGTLYVPLGSVFGSNVSLHDWEVVVLSRAQLVEWLKGQPNISGIEKKYATLLDLISFPEDDFHPIEHFT